MMREILMLIASRDKKCLLDVESNVIFPTPTYSDSLQKVEKNNSSLNPYLALPTWTRIQLVWRRVTWIEKYTDIIMTFYLSPDKDPWSVAAQSDFLPAHAIHIVIKVNFILSELRDTCIKRSQF